MIISYSELYKWDSCQRQWYYSFYLGLQPETLNVAMTTGTKGHKLLQTFFTAIKEGKTKKEAEDYTRKKAQELLRDEAAGDPGLIIAWTMVDNYIRSLDIMPQAVMVENRFLIPAAKLSDDPTVADVQIGFTPDIVFKRVGDFYDVEDSKFVQRAWSKKKQDRFTQAKLYQIFLRRMGYNVSRSAIRFFNTTTGQISVKTFELKPAEEETIIRDFIGGIREVVLFKESSIPAEHSRRTTNNSTCQFCDFVHPCNLQAEGKDASKTFQFLYEKRTYDYSK